MNAGSPRRDVTAIVLAGGRSSRFGSDKLAVNVDGSAVLERAIAAVTAISVDVVVAGPGPGAPLGTSTRTAVRIIADPEPFGGPLQALGGALAATPADLAIVVAGDMPWLVPGVLAMLVEVLDRTPDADAVVLGDPRDPSRLQPLPAAIRVEPARRAAAATLDAGERSLVRMLGRLRLAEVPADRWQPFDPEARSLLDIDVPEDLDRTGGGARDQRMR